MTRRLVPPSNQIDWTLEHNATRLAHQIEHHWEGFGLTVKTKLVRMRRGTREKPDGREHFVIRSNMVGGRPMVDHKCHHCSSWACVHVHFPEGCNCSKDTDQWLCAQHFCTANNNEYTILEDRRIK